MKLNIMSLVAFFALVALLSGCTKTTAKSTPEVVNAQSEKPEVVLVPARKSEEGSSKTEVVERDGKYYEMLKEHERMCSDCDK